MLYGASAALMIAGALMVPLTRGYWGTPHMHPDDAPNEASFMSGVLIGCFGFGPFIMWGFHGRRGLLLAFILAVVGYCLALAASTVL